MVKYKGLTNYINIIKCIKGGVMEKLAILLDSSADINEELEKELGVHVIRMPLIIDNKEYLEEVEIKRDELIKKMREGKMVKTSQPPIGALIEMVDDLLERYEEVIFVPISSELSGTYLTGLNVAKEYNGRLEVVDALLVSSPLKNLVGSIRELSDAGLSAHEIREVIEREAYMYACLIPDDIVYLKRGGRISPAAAAVANLLKIVPVLSVTEGKIDLVDKVRTHKKAIMVGIDKVFEGRNIEDYEWVVVDGDCSTKVFDSVVKEVEKRIGRKPEIGSLSPIILAHTGPGTVALCAYKKIGKGNK